MAVQLLAKRKTHCLGIDVPTSHASRVVKRLELLKTTQLVSRQGPYREDPGYTQVWVDTRMTEDELDDWCYRTKGIEYVGVWERREDQQVA